MVSLLRVLVIVALVESHAPAAVVFPVISAAAVFGLFGAVLLWRQADTAEVDAKLDNPFDVAPLAVFAASCRGGCKQVPL
jgi:uncharacterized membrane protein (DUF4010 family)